MPNIKSAKKRMELSRKWNAANRQKRAALRTAVKTCADGRRDFT